MDGILNINKPWGKTSFSLVAMVKQLSGERRVGHAGTLDPAATGVLPICLGQGTRVVEFLVDATKTYRAEIELGVVTDTYDATGQIIQRADPSGIDQNQLESALAAFNGLIWQTPPMYSAIKYRGRPLYQLARAGISVERKSRLAKIERLELIDWQPPLATVEVVCGKGTYIRSLAYDLGQALGCGAYLKSLSRLRCGIFNIKDAISVPQLEDAFRYGYWQQFIYPIDSVLLHLAAVVVSDDAKQSIRNGRSLILESAPSPENRCRAYTLDGCFLGVLRFNSENGGWQPEKVLG
ncbi:MAG: tRNA pseudouridine(55) synthase TruB [Chloroflexi bacterium]|nr:tRNA pseudouridine(55) synthase TruB [Chloroflexota bacterium]